MLASIPLKATTQYQKGQKIFIKYSLFYIDIIQLLGICILSILSITEIY